MATKLHRCVREPIRKGLSWDERWKGPDRGLIGCWERGRAMRDESPELAARAEKGELMILVWKGGVQQKLKSGDAKPGTLYYLATWQGLRGEDLDISRDGERVIVCTRTDQAVAFTAALPEDEEPEK